MYFMFHVISGLLFAGQMNAYNWPLDGVSESMILRGSVSTLPGAFGKSMVLDGESLIELKDSAKLTSGAFTVSLWFNPYDLRNGQQMLAGKNRYSLNQRQWSLIIDPDGHLRAYLHLGGWTTISSAEPL
ncbi:MAG: LamG-like jellyroll fold domain-containing protein [Gemmataceae bacterium]